MSAEPIRVVNFADALAALEKISGLHSNMSENINRSKIDISKNIDIFLQLCNNLSILFPNSSINRAKLFVEEKREMLIEGYSGEFSDRFDQIWAMSSAVSDVKSIFYDVFVEILPGDDFMDQINVISDDSIKSDFVEESNCLRMGFGTASVFHQSRALEAATKKIARRLRIPGIGVRSTWHDISGRIDGHLRSMPERNAKQKERRRLLAALSAALSAARLGWRNDVMHPGAVYTHEEARSFFTISLQTIRAYEVLIRRT